MSNAKVIIVGGGLSGLSAAHTVLERGGNVVSTPARFNIAVTDASDPARQELVHGCEY
jgi:glycine/D-amino acid oxidase-like deaminating enzyme